MTQILETQTLEELLESYPQIQEIPRFWVENSQACPCCKKENEEFESIPVISTTMAGDPDMLLDWLLQQKDYWSVFWKCHGCHSVIYSFFRWPG